VDFLSPEKEQSLLKVTFIFSDDYCWVPQYIGKSEFLPETGLVEMLT
jgi:hypothetical protein